MEEKQLKKRLKKLYPGRRAEKIDNHQGNGVDDREDDESKKEWRRRILLEHSVEIAQEEKEAGDTQRAAEIDEALKQKEAARVAHEHLTHRTELGVHEARIKHAEKMHEKATAKSEETVSKLLNKKTWKVKAKKEGVKKKDALRQEAEERGIQGAEGTRRKKNLRKKIVADAEQKAASVDAEHRSKVEEERDRLERRKQAYDEFAETHGVDQDAPLGDDAAAGDAAPAAFEPSDAEQQKPKGGKKFGRKKGKKAKSADRDFDDFENPLATDDVQYADT